MGFFSNLFSSSKNQVPVQPILVDIHSHLLPGLDDGVKTFEESIWIIKELIDLGYKKLITTPHIMGDFYKNTPDLILKKCEELQSRLNEEGINIEIQAAAEYYLDETFISKLKNGEQLLTFGDNYLLFETSYLNEPSNLFEAIALIKQNGYWPILAHPERYQYLYRSIEKFEALYDQQLSFQLNINSLSGYYSKPAQVYAQKLLDKNMINFVGTDTHHIKHIESLKKTMLLPQYAILTNQQLFNNSLLSV